MGKKKVGEAENFGRIIADFINSKVEQNGGDASGRWLSSRLGRSPTYWYNRQAFTSPFNFNDIDVIAHHFGKTPLGFLQEIEDQTGESVSSTSHPKNASAAPMGHIIDLQSFDPEAAENRHFLKAAKKKSDYQEPGEI